MNNIKVAKSLIKLAKSLLASELNEKLFHCKSAKQASKYINSLIDKYTHDVYNNEDKSFKKLNEAKEVINNLGMTLVNKQEHVIQDKELGSWMDTYHYEYINDEGNKFTIAVQFNVMLGGTVEDHELSYDFTVWSYDENEETNVLPSLSDDDRLNMMKNISQVKKYIYSLVDKYTHDVYDNRNHDYKVLNEVYDIIDKLGMEIINNETDKHEKGYTDTMHYHFMNNSGDIMKVDVIFNVFYAGSMDDIKNRYDFTVEVR